MCRERRGVVCFRVKLSGPPLDRARCLLLQAAEQSWLPFKGRTACSLTPAFPAARQRMPECCTCVYCCSPRCLEVPRTNTWCGAEDGGRYVPPVLHGRVVARFLPRGPRRPEHGLLPPHASGPWENKTRDPGACSSLLCPVPGLGFHPVQQPNAVPRHVELPRYLAGPETRYSLLV